jgi:hypothetical protein
MSTWTAVVTAVPEALDREREEAARAEAAEVARLQHAIAKGQAQLAAIKDHLATLQQAAPTALTTLAEAADSALARTQRGSNS